MQPEKRRAIFEAVVAKHAKLGEKFEDDPGFTASVEEWIAGKIEIEELQARYRMLHQLRHNAKSVHRQEWSSRKIRSKSDREYDE